MPLTLPSLRVGNPQNHEGLTVFPLFVERGREVAYRLSVDALADQSVVVEEISESGSVPDLRVENKGDFRVLFLEGEELVGAKQNRILNTSVLIPPGAKVVIPVSCVEQGRWRYKSRYFGSSDSYSPSKLRRTLKASVSRSVRERGEYRSDQGAIWQDVADLHACHNVDSDSAAMSDAYVTHRDKIAAYQSKLPYVAGASGLAVAVGDKVVSLDVFDKAATCEKVWSRLLSGVVFDAIEAGPPAQPVTSADVERLLGSATSLPWQAAQAVGEGEEYRAASDAGEQASALVCEGALVHGSLVC